MSRANSLVELEVDVGAHACGLVQATHLESLGFDLSSALWSAALLRSEDANTNDAIVRVHKDYLTSGAQIIGTLTYQLSNKACAKAGWSKDEISQVAPLFEKAIHLAHEANARSQQQGGPRGLVSLTLGPYGAALANGSEYTGNYAEKGVEDSGSTQQPSFEDLTNFHFQRLTQAFDTAMSAKIDLIAFETIPRLDEAQAIVAALDRLAGCSDVTEGKLPPAYISFVFPPDAGGFLPFPPAEPEEHRKGPKEVVQFMCQAQAESKWPVTGVGINCTKPQLLRHAAEQMSGCMSQSSDWQALTLFVSRWLCGRSRSIWADR